MYRGTLVSFITTVTVTKCGIYVQKYKLQICYSLHKYLCESHFQEAARKLFLVGNSVLLTL